MVIYLSNKHKKMSNQITSVCGFKDSRSKFLDTEEEAEESNFQN